ncbi:MAG: nicotinate phosphoribosyltransferase [Peptococcaceae bacterium]|jgi:nicotinate phosphoribosyltransferase|nr:nicotinate phosphoribosyltransferase [Peptococcaceae bacterium]
MNHLALLTDLYQLTMMQGYFRQGFQRREGVFDLFFRALPGGSGYALAAGLEQAIAYLEDLSFSAADIAYLRGLSLFDENFLAALYALRFHGDVDALPEGSPVFPHEPILRVKAPLLEAQLIETALLNIVNHQTLIATKASRIVAAAGGGAVMEFGLRRAQGPDAGIFGSRAAYIGGCISTSNVLAGQRFGIPVAGTMAHSWVQSFKREIDAFRAYAEVFPEHSLFLVDTYNVLRSGVPNAIQAGLELEAQGHHFLGIRIDSGDLAYLSREARKMLDAAGLTKALIVGSNDLNEDTIWSIRNQDAAIDTWGVGTHLITSQGASALGGVYKLAAEGVDGYFEPRMKVSENTTKITNPGIKKIVRFYDRQGKALADLIALEEESFPEDQPLTIFDALQGWKQKTLHDFTTRDLLVPVFRAGQCVYARPELPDIQQYARRELDTLWDEVKRLTNPHTYIVDLSAKLMALRERQLLKINAEMSVPNENNLAERLKS